MAQPFDEEEDPLFKRRFSRAATLMGGLLLVSGCGTGFAGGLPGIGGAPALDFGEMGPPAYWEEPAGTPPDFTMLPMPTPQPGTPTPPPVTPTPKPTTPPPVSESEFQAKLEDEVLRRANEERAKVGAPALAMEAARRDVARAHSKDMAVRNYFSHTNPDGKSPFDRMKAAGITFTAAGENIAANTYPLDRTVEIAWNGWMNSESHRKNIQNAKYGRTGIGIYVNPANGKVYLTQVFTN